MPDGRACVRSDRFPTTDEWATKRHGTIECSACSQRVRLAQRRLDHDASPDNTYIVEHAELALDPAVLLGLSAREPRAHNSGERTAAMHRHLGPEL